MKRTLCGELSPSRKAIIRQGSSKIGVRTAENIHPRRQHIIIQVPIPLLSPVNFEKATMLFTIALHALLVVRIKAAESSQGSCKAGFLNTVFNTGTPKLDSWPDPIWSTLTSYGIENFSDYASYPNISYVHS